MVPCWWWKFTKHCVERAASIYRKAVSTEMLANFYQTTRHHIAQDSKHKILQSSILCPLPKCNCRNYWKNILTLYRESNDLIDVFVNPEFLNECKKTGLNRRNNQFEFHTVFISVNTCTLGSECPFSLP